MSENGQGSSDNLETPRKPPVLGKMIGWGFAIGFAMFVANLRGAKKDDWFEKQHQLSVGWCNGDAQCLGVVQDHWKHCVDEHHESHRSGKYNRKFTLDEAGVRACLSQSGADQLAHK